MHSPVRRRILVVAHRSVATPAIVDELRRRAGAQPSDIALLIPDAADPATAGWTLKRAARLIGREVGAPVEGLMAMASDPFDAIEAAVRDRSFDEIIISTLPAAGSSWLTDDLPARVRVLGPAVTVVTPPSPPATVPSRS
jgi:hypothetical protein